MKTCATISSVKGYGKAQKGAYLERRSTTIMMTELLPTFGRTTINSMEMSVEMGRDYIDSWVLIVSPLLHW